MTPVLHAVWIAAWVLVALVFFGVAVLGMIGLARAAYRLGVRRGWGEPRPMVFAMAMGVVAFLGGWLIYVCWWPLARLFRPWPRLRILGPVIGVFVLIVGGGVTVTTVGGPCAFDPPPGDVSAVPVVNNTSRAIVIGECHDSACRSLDQNLLVASEATGALQVEACNGGQLGIIRRGESTPYACLHEPTEDADGRLASVRVSEAGACR